MSRCISGINDLETINPELALEWHPIKNGNIRPYEIAYSSKKKVWWLGKCGHEWEATVGSRNIGRGCPICAGYKVLEGYNDLETISPTLANEWLPALNEGKKPCQVLAGSHKYATWKCSKCSFIWKAEIRARVRGNGCPNCRRSTVGESIHKKRLSNGNTLANSNPELIKEWDYEKNTTRLPENVTPQSKDRVWWICKKCNYEWLSTVHNRVNGSGCPVCSGHIVISGKNDLLSQNKGLALEWNYPMNGTLKPEDIHFSSGKNVWWICKYGHEWKATVHDRTKKNTGCPICGRLYRTSFSEQSIYYFVSSYFPEAINSYRPDNLKKKELDIYIPSLRVGIEYDGSLYHNDLEKDKIKDKLCAENNIKLIRVREPNCPKIDRKDPIIYLKDNSYSALNLAITELLRILGIINININVEREKQNINALFYATAIRNSVAEMYPDLAAEWSERNGNLKPEYVPAYKSKTKYLWCCKKCKYEWQATLLERIKGTGCPVCSNKIVISGVNDFATTHKELMKEWDSTRNTNIDPHKISFGSQENVWWICSKCGCEWSTRVNRRVNGYGCPNCARQRRKRAVVQMALDGKEIRKFDSLAEASNETGVSKSGICVACKNGKAMKGYLWKYLVT